MLHVEISADMAVYGESTKDTCKGRLKINDKVLNNFSLESSGRVSLAAASTNVAFNFQSVANGQFLLLTSDSEFTVKLNGTGNPAITVKPRTNSETNVKTPAFLALLCDAVTSLHFGNAGSSPIEVDVVVAGT